MPGSRIVMAMVVGISSLFIPPASTTAKAPEKGPALTIRVLSANGSGCPGGAVADVQPTGAVMVGYRNFAVSGGDYRSCVVMASVATPAGWTYLIPSVRNRVLAKLGASGSAAVSTNMWFTGFAWTVTDDKQVDGPLDGYWTTIATPGQPLWAPCGESLNLAVAETVRVTGAPVNGATLVSTTLNPPNWKRC
jgi:hypothetical protein